MHIKDVANSVCLVAVLSLDRGRGFGWRAQGTGEDCFDLRDMEYRMDAKMRR